MKRSLGLRTRLFVWLLLAVVAGMVASSVVWMIVRSEVDSGPLHGMSRVLAADVASKWDDPAAASAAVLAMRESSGMDLELRRDVGALPKALHAHSTNLVFDHGAAFVPVTRDGQLLGAIQFTQRSLPGRPVRMAVFFCVALIVLGLAAVSVSARVVRPLEHVADTAHRFGAGDLTARTKVDKQASEEVREVARAFDAMATRIERLVRDQRELLGAVSHELRSPLGRARVALELLRDQGAPAAAIERVDRALTEVDAILGDLLSITRAGLSDLHKEPTRLLELLKKRVVVEADEQVVLKGDEGISAVVDPVLFSRAVANVIDNARHHGSGEISVSVARSGERAVVTVLDHGSGLPPELIDKAFDPFVRGDAARTHHHASTGLGLAIVRRVLEAHGGAARIRNVESGGKVVGAEVSLEVPST